MLAGGRMCLPRLEELSLSLRAEACLLCRLGLVERGADRVFEGPVGEAAGRVMGPDDQSRANDGVEARKRLGDGVFAEHLERAVIRVVLEQAVGGEVSESLALALFVGGSADVGVDGDARDEEVVVDG